MRFRYKLGLVAIVILIAVCLMTFQSYALWIVSLHGEQENVVNVGCFTIEFKEEETGTSETVTSKSINLTNTYPVKDKTGLDSTPYTFTIKNTCSINTYYHVTLNTSNTNTLEDQYIKYAFYKDTKPETGYELEGQKVNEDLTELTDSNLTFGKSKLKKSYLLASGILKNNESVTYHLNLWMAEKADNTQAKKKFEASLNVINDATNLEKLPETNVQEQVYPNPFPNTSIDEQDASGNGLVTQTHEDEETSGGGLLDKNWTKSELRFVGSNPDNYVEFNGELWRIIGLVNVKTTSGNIEQRLKIVRKDSIGNYAWSESGSNDWTQASLMTMLNNNYYPKIGNFTSSENGNVKGLEESARNMIDKNISWNLGGMPIYNSTSNGLITHWYEHERGAKTPNNIPSELKEKVGLIYPSDYGYATSGSKTGTTREQCLLKEMFNWKNNGYLDCVNNDWLKPINGYMSLLTINSNTTTVAFALDIDGYIGNTNVSTRIGVWPVVYLSPSVEIFDGTGKENDSFKLRDISLEVGIQKE